MLQNKNPESIAAPPRRRASVAVNLIHYIPSIIFRNTIGVLNTLLRPKLMGPQSFGLWSLLNVIPSYTRHLQLGSRLYMRYEIPRLQAAGREEEVQAVEASVFTGTMAPNTGIAAALVLLAAVAGWMTLEVRIGLVAMAGLVVLNAMYDHRITVLKGHQLYRDLSHVMYIRNTVQLILSVILMIYFGLYGLLIAMCTTQLLVLFILRFYYQTPRTARFSRTIYFDMVRQGLPLAVNGFLLTIMVTSGRLLVASYLSTEEVGFYALASMMQRGMLQFPGAAREVLEPRIMENTAALHQSSIQRRYLFRPLLLNACYLPLMIAPAYFLLPSVVEALLPRYTQSILPLQITLFGFFFFSISFPVHSFLIAHKLQRAAMLCSLAALLVNIVLSVAALEMGTGITGVAVANCISYAVLMLSRITLLRWKRDIRFSLSFIWPVITALPLLWAGLWLLQTKVAPHLPAGLPGALILSVLFCGCAAVLLTVAERFAQPLKGLSPLSMAVMLIRRIKK